MDQQLLTMEAELALSIVNMKLRNDYGSFEALCEDLNMDSNLLMNRLATIHYRYHPDLNQFIYSEEIGK